MQLIDLTPEERKKVLNVFTIKDLRMAAEMSDFNQNHYIKRFTKKLDRISKKEIDDYVSKVYTNLHDPIVDQCISAICMAIGAKFQYADEVSSLLEDTAYEDISDELRDELEKYRDAFENSGLKLDYETFIKLNTSPDPFEALRKIHAQLVEDHMEALNKLSEANTTIDKLMAEKDKLQNEIKKNKNETSNLRGDHEANKERIRQYKKLLSPQNVKSTVSKELGCSINGKTYNDIYQELSSKETECLKSNKLSDAMTVLAAKYAVITGMKGNG